MKGQARIDASKISSKDSTDPLRSHHFNSPGDGHSYQNKKNSNQESVEPKNPDGDRGHGIRNRRWKIRGAIFLRLRIAAQQDADTTRVGDDWGMLGIHGKRVMGRG